MTEELSMEIEDLHHEIDVLHRQIDRLRYYIYNINHANNPTLPKTLLYLVFTGIIMHLFDLQIPINHIVTVMLVFGYIYSITSYNNLIMVYDNKQYIMLYDSKNNKVLEVVKINKQ